MKASELNGTHLGRRITVTENRNSATGKLRDIEHKSDIINDTTFSGESFESLGATWVVLHLFGNHTMTVNPGAEVTIHE